LIFNKRRAVLWEEAVNELDVEGVEAILKHGLLQTFFESGWISLLIIVVEKFEENLKKKSQDTQAKLNRIFKPVLLEIRTQADENVLGLHGSEEHKKSVLGNSALLKSLDDENVNYFIHNNFPSFFYYLLVFL
jgi:hypothetical protein